jgi:hypothetical protein
LIPRALRPALISPIISTLGRPSKIPRLLVGQTSGCHPPQTRVTCPFSDVTGEMLRQSGLRENQAFASLLLFEISMKFLRAALSLAASQRIRRIKLITANSPKWAGRKLMCICVIGTCDPFFCRSH